MRPFPAVSLLLLAFVSVAQAQDSDKAAMEHFERYLTGCPESEIRCVWFLNGSARVGMVMTLNMSASEVTTVREVHDFARQSLETRKLSQSQVKTLKTLTADMPRRAESKDPYELVYISLREGNSVVVTEYLRHKLPREVERIYDIGGGYIDTAPKQ